MQVAREIAT